MSDELIAIREFARRVGVSDTAVLKAIKAGKITADCLDHTNPKRPKIYPLAALRSWGRNYAPNWNQSPALDAAISETNAAAMHQDHSSNAPASRSPAQVKARKKAQPDQNDEQEFNQDQAGDDEDIIDDDEGDHIRLSKRATINEAKRVESIAQAKLAQVKLAEQKGRLVSRVQIDKEFFDAGVRVRSALQGLPDKIIDNLLACDTRSEAHSMLYAAITEALEGLVLTNTGDK